MKKIIISLLLLIVFVQAADLSQQEINHQNAIIESLDWINGPKFVNVGLNASFNVPEGYVFLNPQDTATLMELIQNPKSLNEYFFGPNDMHWFGLFSYEDTGYVKDDEKIDASSLLESLKAGTEAGNKIRIQKGWPTMTILGWKYKPFYDPQTKRLDWAIDGISDNVPVINYNTRILGRSGVTSVTLVTGPDNLQADVADFKNTVDNYQFNSDNQYSAFKEGDKIAEYGLMALIAGGAAAVATKKGFFAVIAASLAAFWKLIAVGFIALLAGIGKFFGKKD